MGFTKVSEVKDRYFIDFRNSTEPDYLGKAPTKSVKSQTQNQRNQRNHPKNQRLKSAKST